MNKASLQRGQLTGNMRFVEEIEHKIERRMAFRGLGRPWKQEKQIYPHYKRKGLQT